MFGVIESRHFQTNFSGQVIQFGVLRDVTQKKNQEQGLQHLLDCITKLHDKKMFYGIVDKKGNYVYADRAGWEEVLGIPQSLPIDQVREAWIKGAHPDEREKIISYLKDLSFPPLRDYRIIHPQKGLRWIRTVTYWHSEHLISFSEDVTEEKQREQSLGQASSTKAKV